MLCGFCISIYYPYTSIVSLQSRTSTITLQNGGKWPHYRTRSYDITKQSAQNYVHNLWIRLQFYLLPVVVGHNSVLGTNRLVSLPPSSLSRVQYICIWFALLSCLLMIRIAIFTNILYGCFTANGEMGIIRLPQYPWNHPDEYGYTDSDYTGFLETQSKSQWVSYGLYFFLYILWSSIFHQELAC